MQFGNRVEKKSPLIPSPLENSLHESLEISVLRQLTMLSK